MKKRLCERFLFRNKTGEEKEVRCFPEQPESWPYPQEEIAAVFRYVDCTDEFYGKHPSPLPDLGKAFMQKLQLYIEAHYMDLISLADVLELTGMGRSRFCNFFKQQTGATFTEYINKVRLEHATQILANGDQPVDCVGYDCGFPSPSNFYKLFKKEYGVSPGEFRKRSHKFARSE